MLKKFADPKRLAILFAILLVAAGAVTYSLYSRPGPGTILSLPTTTSTSVTRIATTTLLRSGTTSTIATATPGSPKDILELVNREILVGHITKLASPELRGRLSGDEGQYLAAKYLADEFKSYGLKPVGNDGTYFQYFEISFWQAKPPTSLRMISPSGPTWSAGDIVVFTYSGSTNATTQLAFVGYGITLPEKNYDDYANVNVQGKVVLLFRHGPRDDESWENQYGVWKFGYKAVNAFNHGAVGMMLVNDYNHQATPTGGATLSTEAYRTTFGAVWADRSIGEQMIRAAGKDLAELQKQIDSNLSAASLVTNVSIQLQVTTEFDPARKTMNVVGAIEGSDPALKSEVVIVSGHYDHLGVDSSGAIYYGADDDASGTAGVLESARVLALTAAKSPFRRTIFFVGWSGEEEGLLGSRYYVAHPLYSLEKTVAVIQMDMIGVGSFGLRVYQGRSFPSLYERLRLAANLVGLPIEDARDLNASDHAPFAAAGVPAVLLFTTGDHPDYHTPRDTADKIDGNLLAAVTKVAASAAWSYAIDIPIAPTPLIISIAFSIVVSVPRRL